MTKNEQIASILLEAAELLKNDPELDSLNEGIIKNLIDKFKNRNKDKAKEFIDSHKKELNNFIIIDNPTEFYYVERSNIPTNNIIRYLKSYPSPYLHKNINSSVKDFLTRTFTVKDNKCEVIKPFLSKKNINI